MRKHHAKNERIKRRYLAYLEEAKRLSVSSADQAAAAIASFETSTGYKDFVAFHIEQARRFKRLLQEQKKEGTGKPLSKATLHSRLSALRSFFQWLASQPGYRKISYADAEYFNLSANDSRVATATREKSAASLDDIAHVIASIDLRSDVDLRDRAVIAFALISGARDDAIASFLTRDVDLERRTVFQDARHVRTKNRKTFTSWFFPVGGVAEQIVRDWVHFLIREKLFGPDDPLFPATLVRPNSDGLFDVAGLSRMGWATAGPIRRIFDERFTAAGLPYFHPHSFRDTLTQLGERICRTPEEMKAWSQNFGHEKVATTLMSYGQVAGHRQAEIFNSLRNSQQQSGLVFGDPDAETINRVLEYLRRKAA